MHYECHSHRDMNSVQTTHEEHTTSKTSKNYFGGARQQHIVMWAVGQESDTYVIDNMKNIKSYTDAREGYHSLRNSQWFFRNFCISHFTKRMIHRRRMYGVDD